jgi:hypothetical protein
MELRRVRIGKKWGGFSRYQVKNSNYSYRKSKSNAVKQFLRSPSVIIVEIAAITLAGILGATFPQGQTAGLPGIAGLYTYGQALPFFADILALDHVFNSAWFLAITLLAALSLSIVVFEQIGRLRILWPKSPDKDHFKTAPFRAEFERPARIAAVRNNHGPFVDVRTKNRIGLAGSPIFHSGLLVLMVAGALRALLAVEAVVDLIEDETLPATSMAWAAQWPGILSQPFKLDDPVILDDVRATSYKGGDLFDLKVSLLFKKNEEIVEKKEIAVNQELRAPGGRLYLDSKFGPAALLEWLEDPAPPTREAVLLESKGNGVYEGASSESKGLRIYLRAAVDHDGNHPTQMEARVMEDRSLVFADIIHIGERISLPGNRMLQLHAIPFWARLHGGRDPALWLAYAGFALALAGSIIMFFFVKVDTCVVVTPFGDREMVFVALKAQRFAPVYREQFQRLVNDQGGIT